MSRLQATGFGLLGLVDAVGTRTDAAGEVAAERRGYLAHPVDRARYATLDVDAGPLGAAAGGAPSPTQPHAARQLVGHEVQLGARSFRAADVGVLLGLFQLTA